MGVTGCYVLRVECDEAGHNRGVRRHAEFTGVNKTEAKQRARAAGWFLGYLGAVACPTCREMRADVNRRAYLGT